MFFDTINPITDARWDDFIISNPRVSVFHSSFWARVLSESYGFEPRYLIRVSNGKLAIAIPLMIARDFISGRRAISLPFSDYCDLLLGEGIVIADAFEALHSYGKGDDWRSVEIRMRGTFPADVLPSFSFFGHVLDLKSDPSSIYASFKENTRRNISKAERCGVSVDISTTDSAMGDFYRLNCLTRREHGLPPQPLVYFKTLSHLLQSHDRGFIAISHYDHLPIAGAIFLHFGGNAVFKYGASDKRYWNLRANNLIMWEAIRKLLSLGAKSLCFGRTDKKNEGLRKYKRSWGAMEEEISYAKYDFRKESYTRSDFLPIDVVGTFFRKLPIHLSRTIGNMIYKYMA